MIVVEAGSSAEARQQIAYDLNVDAGAYGYDLEPVEDGVGEITIKEESQHEERT